MSKDISSKNIYNLYMKLLPAQIFVVITGALSGIVNGILVGNNLSQEAMVALGFVGPLSALVTACASIVAGGSGVIVGHYMGSGETERINKTFTVSMITASFIGVLLFVACFAGADPIAMLLGAKDANITVTASYIRGLSFGFIGQCITSSVMAYLNLCNKAKVSLLLTALLACLNLGFGVVAVMVIKGGVFAVASAAALAQICTAAVGLIYILNAKNTVRLEKGAFDIKVVGRIIALGSPAAVANILYPTRNIFINSFALKVGGAVAMNALAIMSSIGGILDSFNIGIGSATLMLASLYSGEKDRSSLVRLAKTAIRVGLITAFARMVILYFFSDDIAYIFGADQLVAYETFRLLFAYSFSMPINIFTVVFMNFYQTQGRTMLCDGIYLVNCILVPLACCLFLTDIFGTLGIYSCYALAEVVTMIVVFAMLFIRKKRPVFRLDEILMIDDELKNVESMSVSVNEINEVSGVSENIIEFLEKHGIDSRRAKMSGLCAEEMAGNIVEHGFTKDNKKHVIDIYASVTGDDIYLRIKDDCVPFDPHSKLSQYNPDDPCKNIGIRMVSKIAKEMNYQVNFGMNVLTVKM